MARSPNGKADKIVRAEIIRKAAAERNVEFPLPHSGGGTALVRKLTVQDLIALESMPTSSQAAVAKMLESVIRDGNAKVNMSIADMMKAMGGPIEGIRLVTVLADAAIIAGFVDPQVMYTREEVKDESTQVALEDIDSRDRMSFWEFCQDAEEAESKAYATFFQSGQAGAGVPAPRDSDNLPLLQTIGSYEDERG